MGGGGAARDESPRPTNDWATETVSATATDRRRATRPMVQMVHTYSLLRDGLVLHPAGSVLHLGRVFLRRRRGHDRPVTTNTARRVSAGGSGRGVFG